MNQLAEFYGLKQLVLLRYQEEYPYVAEDWKQFSSKDIVQLIDSIEEATRQRISEKWIYTHLKPAENEKLPRKDMLDILANYCCFDSWDAYVFSLQPTIADENSQDNNRSKSKKKWLLVLLGCILIGCWIFWYYVQDKSVSTSQKTVSVKDYYTKEKIEDTTVQLFLKENGTLKPLPTKEIPAQEIKKQSEIVVESPFYSEAKVEIEQNTKTIVLKPDDNAMMLKAFIHADIKDWETRKIQLNNMLADNLEVLIHLQNNLGIEYMNKEEFAQKLTIPTAGIKRWQILSIEQDAQQRILKIRIKQNGYEK
jgi:hypothetical protein